MFDSVKSLFLKVGACCEIWAGAWRTSWQRQVTLTSSAASQAAQAGYHEQWRSSNFITHCALLARNHHSPIWEIWERTEKVRTSFVAANHFDWKLGWYSLGGRQKPKLTSRGVISFLVECKAMSQSLLKDESQQEHISPCVNNTTTQHDIPEIAKTISRQEELYCITVPCLLLKQIVQTELNRLL